MKALSKLKKQKGLWLNEVPKPTYGHDEVCIKIRKTAICGTDLHIYQWNGWAAQTIPVPLVVGHEFVGEVVGVGDHVDHLKIGDRVSGEGHITCGYCRNCRAGDRHLCRHTQGVGVQRNGAFAEYLVMPAFNVYQIPNDISDSQASVLDPFGNAVHTALSFDLVGEDVLITGAGPIGLMAVAIARHVGARFVVATDLNEYRLDLARKMGATLAINPKKSRLSDVMTDLGMVEGFDVGMEMSGSEHAFQGMLDVMNNGGRIAYLGLAKNHFPINWHQVIFKSLTIKGIYGRRLFDTWYKGVCMLQAGLDIKPAITGQYHYTEFEAAFESMMLGKSGKIILDWCE